jgi:hypothetical protein
MPHSSQRLPFLQALQAVLANAHPLHNSLLSTRLTKALLPSLCAVLAAQSESHRSGYNSSKSKKGKKRVQGYEGDELFKVSREVICPTIEDGKVVLATLDGMLRYYQHTYLTSLLQSCVCLSTVHISLQACIQYPLVFFCLCCSQYLRYPQRRYRHIWLCMVKFSGRSKCYARCSRLGRPVC